MSEREYICGELSVFDVVDRLVWYEFTRGRDVTPQKLYKLLYYVQAIGLGKYGRRVFCGDFEGWAVGPMIVEVYERYRGYGIWPIDVSIDLVDMCEEVDRIISEVSDVFGVYEAYELENLVRSEDPWLSSREGLGEYERGNRLISDESIRDYVKGYLLY